MSRAPVGHILFRTEPTQDFKRIRVPKVSEYILANDLRVKHQPIEVDANATLPLSGDTRRAGSSLTELERKSKHLQNASIGAENLQHPPDASIHFLDGLLQFEVCILWRDTELKDEAIHFVHDQDHRYSLLQKMTYCRFGIGQNLRARTSVRYNARDDIEHVRLRLRLRPPQLRRPISLPKLPHPGN